FSLAVLSYKFSVFSKPFRTYELKTFFLLCSPSSELGRAILLYLQLKTNNLKLFDPLPNPKSKVSSQSFFTDNLKLRTENSLRCACFRAGLARLLLQTLASDANAFLLVRIRR